MEKISFNLNVNFVVILLNGFVGEILIFVNHVIKGNVMEITLVNTLKINCLNVKVLENVHQEVITVEMVKKKV